MPMLAPHQHPYDLLPEGAEDALPGLRKRADEHRKLVAKLAEIIARKDQARREGAELIGNDDATVAANNATILGATREIAVVEAEISESNKAFAAFLDENRDKWAVAQSKRIEETQAATLEAFHHFVVGVGELVRQRAIAKFIDVFGRTDNGKAWSVSKPLFRRKALSDQIGFDEVCALLEQWIEPPPPRESVSHVMRPDQTRRRVAA